MTSKRERELIGQLKRATQACSDWCNAAKIEKELLLLEQAKTRDLTSQIQTSRAHSDRLETEIKQLRGELAGARHCEKGTALECDRTITLVGKLEQKADRLVELLVSVQGQLNTEKQRREEMQLEARHGA